MARAMYVKYRNGVMGGGGWTTLYDLDNASVDVKVALTDHGGGDGAPDVVNDDFYDDIDGSTVGSLSPSGGITNPTIGTVAAGVFDGDNVTFTAVSGASVESFSLLVDTATPSTSPLIAYWDDATGLPVTPNGGDITITWSGSGIFTF